MERSKFTGEPTAFALGQPETVTQVTAVCRPMGNSQLILSNGKKYGGLAAPEI